MRKRQLQELYKLEETYWWFIGRRALIRQLIRKYLPQGGRVLDAGCGTGGTICTLAGCADLYGCDLSPHALEFCGHRGIARLAAGDLVALPYATGSFDGIVSCDVLEHVPDDPAALGELTRVLRPGGYAFMTVPAHQFIWSEHDEALCHLRRYSAREFRRLMQDAGLQVVKLSPVVTFVFPPVFLFRMLQRLRPKAPDQPRTDVRILAGPANRLLVAALRLENWLLRFLNLPVGTSLVAVARKPQAP